MLVLRYGKASQVLKSRTTAFSFETQASAQAKYPPDVVWFVRFVDSNVMPVLEATCFAARVLFSIEASALASCESSSRPRGLLDQAGPDGPDRSKARRAIPGPGPFRFRFRMPSPKVTAAPGSSPRLSAVGFLSPRSSDRAWHWNSLQREVLQWQQGPLILGKYELAGSLEALH